MLISQQHPRNLPFKYTYGMCIYIYIDNIIGYKYLSTQQAWKLDGSSCILQAKFFFKMKIMDIQCCCLGNR